MGRLELAGINPRTTPPARFWRALWALFVEYSTTHDRDTDAAIRELWGKLAGTVPVAAPAGAPRAAQPAPVPVPADAPRPGQRREGRPSQADMEAWALASAAAGTNTIGAAPPGRSGAAERAGG